MPISSTPVGLTPIVGQGSHIAVVGGYVRIAEGLCRIKEAAVESEMVAYYSFLFVGTLTSFVYKR